MLEVQEPFMLATEGPMTAGSVSRHWSTKTSSKVGAALAVVPTFAFLSIYDYRVNGVSVLWPIGITGFAAVLVYLFALRPYVRVEEDYLVIVNPVRRHRLALRDIREIMPTYSGIEVSGVDRRVRAWAVQKSNLADMLGRTTRADAVVRELESIAAAARAKKCRCRRSAGLGDITRYGAFHNRGCSRGRNPPPRGGSGRCSCELAEAEGHCRAGVRAGAPASSIVPARVSHGRDR